VFSPPLYQREVLTGYWTEPYVDKIRDAVEKAFTTDPADEARRQRLAGEGATVWVLNGTGEDDRGTDLAGYLEYQGLAASAPREAPEGAVPKATRIVVYNGAETRIPATIAYLEERFDVTVTTADDPTIRADVVITIGTGTPKLQPPPSS
jgi:hypothetical protein